MWERRYTKRSAQNVIFEIQSVVEQYSTQGIKFFNSTFTVDRKHVESICDALRAEKLDYLPWECEVRANTVDKALLENMKDAGCDPFLLRYSKLYEDLAKEDFGAKVSDYGYLRKDDI